MAAKGFSVVVNIGGKVDATLGGAIGKAESMFAGLTRNFKRQAAAQHAALVEMRNAAGVALSGLGLGHGLAHAIGAGAEFNKEVIALKNAGRTAQEVARGIAKANATVIKLPTTTLAENLKLLNETTGAFGDFHHALENLDFNAKLSSVMQTSFGDKLGDPGEAFNKIVRSFEIRGTAADPEKYQHEMGKMYQAMAFTRGNVNPDQLLNFAQRANPSIRYLDENFLTRIAPSLIQEFGGDTAGSGLTAFRKVIRGGISDSIQAKEWVKMGLVNKDKVRLNKAGQVQGWASGAVNDTNLAFSNPLEWMEKTLLPKLAKKGIDINDEVALGKEFDVLFKNGRSNAFAGAIGQAKSRARLHKDAGLIDLVPTMDKAYENNMDDVKTGVFAVKNAFENLFVSLSGPLLAPASHALVTLAMGVQRVAVFLQQHPLVGGGFGIASGAAAGVAGLTILRSSFALLGLAGFAPIRLLKAELLSLAAMASGAAAGGVRMLGATVLTLINPFRLVRVVAMAARSAMLLSGVGAVVLGIAAAGTFIANNWSGLGRFFTEFGSAFTAALGPDTSAKIQPIIDFGSRLLGIFQSVTAEISPDKWAKWGAAAGVAAADAVKWVEALPGRLPEVAGRFASEITSLAAQGAKALADFDWKSGGRAIVDGIISGISSMGGALASSLTGIASSGVGKLRSMLGLGPAAAAPANDNGPAPSAPGRATGGSIHGGHAYVVGERGPELIIPGGSGTVIPNGNLPAGMRNNNPANLKYNRGVNWRGLVGPSRNTDQGDPQAVFTSQVEGMRAATLLARNKYNKGMRSAAELIAGRRGWTSGALAFPASVNIAKAMGKGRGDDLGLNDPANMHRFMRALLTQEQGDSAKLYSDSMIAQGINAAGMSDKLAKGYGRAHFGQKGGAAIDPGLFTSAGLRLKSDEAIAGGHTNGALFGLAHRLQSEDVPGGLGVFSAFDDAFHHRLPYRSKHVEGLAGDFTLKNAKMHAEAAQAVRNRLTALGLGPKDFRVIDEFANPSGHATGGHIHFQLNHGEAAARVMKALGGNPQAMMAGVAGGTAKALAGRARGYARAHFGGPRKPAGAPQAAPMVAPPPPAAMAALAASSGGGSSTKRTRYQGGAISVEVNVNGAGGAPDEVGRQVAYEVRKVLAQYESAQRGMLSD